jgi:hypothetical protein
MASSKNKLTEEQKQLSEGLFSSIMKNILKGRTRKVLKVIQNDPILKKATQDFDVATKRLKKASEKAAQSHSAAWKNDKWLK